MSEVVSDFEKRSVIVRNPQIRLHIFESKKRKKKKHLETKKKKEEKTIGDNKKEEKYVNTILLYLTLSQLILPLPPSPLPTQTYLSKIPLTLP